MCYLGNITHHQPIALILMTGTVDIISILVIISGNSFIIIAILRRRRHLKNSSAFSTSVSSRFVLSLSFANLVVGSFYVYYQSFLYFCKVSDALGGAEATCVSRSVLMMYAHVVSAYSLVSIAIDRYLAVMYPLKYKNIMDNRNSTVLILAAWIAPSIIAFPVFYWNKWTPSLKCEDQIVFPDPILIFTATVSSVFCMTFVAGVHYKIHKETVASTFRQNTEDRGVVTSRPFLRTKSSQVMIVGVVCYVLFWMPFAATIIVHQFFVYHDENVNQLINVTLSLTNLGYIINPFLYSWKTASVKSAIFRLFDDLSIFRKTFLRERPSVIDWNESSV